MSPRPRRLGQRRPRHQVLEKERIQELADVERVARLDLETFHVAKGARACSSCRV